MKILIVEDSPSVLSFLKKIVNDIGYTDILADNAELAWEIIKVNTDIDLIITDVVLGDMTGLELVHLVRQESQSKDIPIFVCSSKVSKEEVLSYLKEGIQLFIDKPINGKQLQAQVIKTLEPNLAETND